MSVTTQNSVLKSLESFSEGAFVIKDKSFCMNLLRREGIHLPYKNVCLEFAERALLILSRETVRGSDCILGFPFYYIDASKGEYADQIPHGEKVKGWSFIGACFILTKADGEVIKLTRNLLRTPDRFTARIAILNAQAAPNTP